MATRSHQSGGCCRSHEVPRGLGEQTGEQREMLPECLGWLMGLASSRALTAAARGRSCVGRHRVRSSSRQSGSCADSARVARDRWWAVQNDHPPRQEDERSPHGLGRQAAVRPVPGVQEPGQPAGGPRGDEGRVELELAFVARALRQHAQLVVEVPGQALRLAHLSVALPGPCRLSSTRAVFPSTPWTSPSRSRCR